MKYYYHHRNGTIEELTEEDAGKYLSETQIREGIEAKKADPCEEVSYMAFDGFIVIDF